MRELSWWEWLVSSIAAFFVSQCSLAHQENPEKTVNSLFEMARQQKVQEMYQLCDPEGRNDGDTDCLCALSPDYASHTCPVDSPNYISEIDFFTCFSSAQISEPVEYFGENSASVPFRLNPDLCGGKSAESFDLIRRGDTWYLLSF